MVKLIFILGFVDPCISLPVEETIYRPKQQLLDIEVTQKLKKDPSICGIQDPSLGYKWIVTDQEGNEIASSPMESFPTQVGLKNMIIINNQSLPKDFKPPLTFKVLK